MNSVDPMTVSPERLTPRAAAEPVPSPCISVCAVDPDGGYCLGCYRTLDEIAAWISLDSAARLVVWDRIDERKKAADAPDTHS